MPDDQQDQNGAPGETMAAFVARRNREKANAALGPLAAHQAYGDSIRTGGDLSFPQPADLTNFATSLFGRASSGQGGQTALGQFGGGFELQNDSQANPHDVASGQAPQLANAQSAQPEPQAQPNLHPGFAESLIPIWGSGKEAYADFKDGNYPGAVLNGLLAGSDLFLGGEIAKAVEKGGVYALRGPLFRKAWRQDWKEVSKEMRTRGMLERGQKGNAGKEGHHWAIPQRAQWAPDFIKNHPINIKELPKAIHRRITGRWQGAPQFNLLEAYWHGTPTWSKVATVDALGHPIAAATTGDHDQ